MHYVAHGLCISAGVGMHGANGVRSCNITFAAASGALIRKTMLFKIHGSVCAVQVIVYGRCKALQMLWLILCFPFGLGGWSRRVRFPQQDWRFPDANATEFTLFNSMDRARCAGWFQIMPLVGL